MKTIAVQKEGLLSDFDAWGVKPSYARFFLEKCEETNGLISLGHELVNDSYHLTNPYQWFAANVAFWCRVYREAQAPAGQVEALAAIRAIYYIAGSLGLEVTTRMIALWWKSAQPLHGLPAPNQSHHSGETRQIH
ncbi:Uncharacterised protein [Serratia marcescens]|uniref:hypothetical protein n=1 Tax=Serratia marcescens TaxID=615 RepID=UPI00074545DD|nr:hypothetical protein [Serratia marcescens]CUY82424.1 Uncharacterised protein [Serratia marcescens]CUZ81904.1 Uncharacterised protein [Serratia marcescens]CUZ95807.1 Uncharacterised protein [Serratia marcescens]CVB13190.1 Uncharacterised protein [Serratia marcescens]CVB34150.1 Uncharacterised protein [Serratia marcescens]